MVLEKTRESPLDCKEIKLVDPKGNQSWIFIGRTDTEAEVPILWPPDERIDSLEKTLMLGKTEGRSREEDRGWDGWMASLTEWTWVWASSRRWWRTGKSGLLQSTGWQRVEHDWVTEQQKETRDKICRGRLRPSLLLDVVLCGNEIPDLAKDGGWGNWRQWY